MNRKLPAILLFALLVLLSVLSWMIPSNQALETHGARSSSDEGRRGLQSLLSEFGFEAERWDQRPGALTAGRGLVWLAHLPHGVEPDSAEGGAAKEEDAQGAAPLREALRRGLSNPQHYRRFAAGGGSVLVEISEPQELTRLATDFGFFELEHVELAQRNEVSSQADAAPSCTWISGEPLEVLVHESHGFSGIESVALANVLLEDALGAALIVEVPIGRGRLVLCGIGAGFHNASLSAHDHAVVCIRLAERLSNGGAIRIDESKGLGGGSPALFDLATAPRALPFSVSLLSLALLFLWRSFFAREIPRDPPAVEFMSPRTRALARARLLERARRFDLLAEQLRVGTARRIGALTRVAPPLCAQAPRNVESAQQFARAIGAGGDEARWVQALAGKPVRSSHDLIELDSDLCELEDQLESRVRGAQRGRLG